MITAVQAFEIAHDAITGKRCHNAPCNITIERDGDTYTVTFSSPVGTTPATPADSTRVLIEASSGTMREVRNAGKAEQNERPTGIISAKRALHVGLATLRESGALSDEHWTTTIILNGDKYYVTFPVPEATRRLSETADYALQVWVDSRTGDVVEVMHAS